MEYAYSIQERGRLAALGGDAMMSMPVLCLIGKEAWSAKEAQASEDALPGFGPAEERGFLWEGLTATNYLQAGADLLVLRHPKAIALVRKAIDRLVAEAASMAT